jgi:hypothetical protein
MRRIDDTFANGDMERLRKLYTELQTWSQERHDEANEAVE